MTAIRPRPVPLAPRPLPSSAPQESAAAKPVEAPELPVAGRGSPRAFEAERDAGGADYARVREKLQSPLSRLLPTWLKLPFLGAGSAGKAGWALKEGPPTTDVTADFKSLLAQAQAGRDTLPADAKDYKYLMVSGLLGEHGPTYLDSNIGRLRTLGLSTQEVAVDTEGSTFNNARIVRDAILQASAKGEKVVLVGHSKGGNDITAALGMYPDLKDHVQAVVTLQTPFGGSPVADDVSESWVLRKLLGNVLAEGIFGGSPDTLRDLTYEGRREILRDHPYPVEDVPTVSLATSRVDPRSALFAPAQYLDSRYGYKSDGLVVVEDAMIPGSQTVVLDDMDHLESTMEGIPGFRNYRPGDVTQAMVTLALRAAAEKAQDDAPLDRTA